MSKKLNYNLRLQFVFPILASLFLILILLSSSQTEAFAPAYTGQGTASIDGIMSTGEWDNAASINFTINNFYPGPGYPVTIHLMNDTQNLYIAIEHQGSGVGLFYAEGATIALDRNKSGVVPDIGDDWLDLQTGIFPPTGQYVQTFVDALVTSCQPFSYCVATPDINLGGTQDGSGAIANDGTRTVYEYSHPLNSGDSANDVKLKKNKRINISGNVKIYASPIKLQAEGAIPVIKFKVTY